MKASELKPGDVIATGDWQGWAVVTASMGSVVDADNKAFDVVLLDLEYPSHVSVYMNKSANEIEEDMPAETGCTWMRADDGVCIEKSGK